VKAELVLDHQDDTTDCSRLL